jgi:hypothetical protein
MSLIRGSISSRGRGPGMSYIGLKPHKQRGKTNGVF